MTIDKALVLAATAWKSNAELIADVARLGYIRDGDRVLDPTYGRGIWWCRYRPNDLTTYRRNEDDSDFRKLPEPDDSFDVIAYDPPYVARGGAATSAQFQTLNGAYGLEEPTQPRTPALLQEMINDGLTEMYRLVRPRGIVLVKCQDYISSGKLWLGTHRTLTHALSLGFECVDRLEHFSKAPRAQPHNRQVHARRNLSTLFVLRAPRVKLPPPEPMPDIDICDHCLASKLIGLNLCLVHGSLQLEFPANGSAD